MTDRTTKARGLLARLLREPMTHFLLISLLVLGVYRIETPASAPTPGRDVIEVTPADIARLENRFVSIWRRKPNSKEMTALIDGFIRDEVFYREGLALHLDRKDEVIRQRLVQKVEFLVDSSTPAADPAVVRAHFDAAPDRFAPPPKLSFEQILLREDAPEDVVAQIDSGADAQRFGRANLLPGAMKAAPPAIVDRTFGAGFFDAVMAQPQDAWSGPVASAVGRHLVRVTTFETPAPPSFDAVAEAVRQDLEQARRAEAARARYEAMRRHYTVISPEPTGSAEVGGGGS